MTNNGDPEDQQRGLDASFEDSINSSSRTVTIPLREYDKLKEKQHYITDKSLIDIIDNLERLVRALRKHIHREDL
jgi:hypothetical protein